MEWFKRYFKYVFCCAILGSTAIGVMDKKERNLEGFRHTERLFSKQIHAQSDYQLVAAQNVTLAESGQLNAFYACIKKMKPLEHTFRHGPKSVGNERVTSDERGVFTLRINNKHDFTFSVIRGEAYRMMNTQRSGILAINCRLSLLELKQNTSH